MNKKHFGILKSKPAKWNLWRTKNPDVIPDLSGSNLEGSVLSGLNLIDCNFNEANLVEAKLRKSNLTNANLTETKLSNADLGSARLHQSNLTDAEMRQCNLSNTELTGANLQGADLSGANFHDANLARSDLSKAILIESNFTGANLTGAKLIGADLTSARLIGTNLRNAILEDANLSDADLSRASLVECQFENATLQGCRIYGISVWDSRFANAIQSDLIMTPRDQSIITVDDIKVAQFLYLLMNNPELRDVIDTITSKLVLILGRFTPTRKQVLDVLRANLRSHDYIPVLFDFEGPSSRDLTETISTIAHISKFVIADLTDARSVPQELMAIVPSLPSVPVLPILQRSDQEYGLFEHIRRFSWVLPVFEYDGIEHIAENIVGEIIAPLEARID